MGDAMNKIILSLLLITIAFIGIGAAAASDADNLGSHSPQLFSVADDIATPDNTAVSDVECCDDIQFYNVSDDGCDVDYFSYYNPHRKQLACVEEDISTLDVVSDRPNFDILLNQIATIKNKDVSIGGGMGPGLGPYNPDINPHVPIHIDLRDRPVNPFGPQYNPKF